MTLRRTPFFDQHLALGGRMVPFAGWEMPVQYSGVVAEHQRVRESVGLFDVSHMGEVRVRGTLAEAALQWLLSNDISVMAVGQAQYNVMCNATGGVVDDLVVYKLAADEFLVCVNAANRDKDFAWMVSHNPHPTHAVFTDEGDAWAQVAVQGRNAGAIVQRLTPVDLSTLKTYRFAIGAFCGIDHCIIARTGYTGEDGFEVFVPADVAPPVFAKILEAGADHGIMPIGLGARDTLRLEARYCLYGHELDDTTSPLQAGLGWVTKLEKPGGFLGRDAIVLRRAASEPKLVGLVVEGGRIAREGMSLLVDGCVVGRVTSGTRAPTVDQAIAVAFIDPAFSAPDTVVSVDVRGRIAQATVRAGSFYKRPY